MTLNDLGIANRRRVRPLNRCYIHRSVSRDQAKVQWFLQNKKLAEDLEKDVNLIYFYFIFTNKIINILFIFFYFSFQLHE